MAVEVDIGLKAAAVLGMMLEAETVVEVCT